MITMKIFLMGLVALAPVYGEGRLTVVLPDTRGGGHSHFPMLVFEKKEAKTAFSNEWHEIEAELGLARDPNCREGYDANCPIGGFLLAGEELEISGGMAGALHFVMDKRKHRMFDWLGDFPRTPDEASDFSWVPRMRDVSPGAAILRPLSGNFARGLLRVSGFNGTVKTFRLAHFGDKVPSTTIRRNWRPALPWTYRQALADIVLLELVIPTNQVTVTLKKLATGARRTITLEPSDGVVEVLLGNLAPKPTTCAEVNEKVAGHFAQYYRLAVDADPPVPVKLPRKGGLEINGDRIDQGPMPKVIFAVGEELPQECSEERKGGFNRPMCTLVAYDP